jgi:hypothetical protein
VPLFETLVTEMRKARDRKGISLGIYKEKSYLKVSKMFRRFSRYVMVEVFFVSVSTFVGDLDLVRYGLFLCSEVLFRSCQKRPDQPTMINALLSVRNANIQSGQFILPVFVTIS